MSICYPTTRERIRGPKTGYWNVLHKFKVDNVYATILFAELDQVATLHVSQRVVGQGPFANMAGKESLSLPSVTHASRSSICRENGLLSLDALLASEDDV